MHILLVYQYYHNQDCAASGRHYQFVKWLSKHHKVTILTSDVWEQKRDTHHFDWVPEGVEIHSFPVPYSNAMSVPARLKAFVGFLWHAIRKGLTISKPDVIFGTSTPLTAAWAASLIAGLRRVPWVFEVRDLWPDFPIQMGAIQSGWIQKRLFNLEHRLYRSASHVITLSPDMERHVLKRGIPSEKVTTLVNGTDIELADAIQPEDISQLKKQYQLEGKKVVLYAGTLGRANAIPTIIQTANRLRHRADVQFVIMGEGYYKPALEKAAKRLRNITVLSPVARHHIFNWFRLAQVSLVTFIDRPVLKANSPAKFFDSLSVGTPVIVTNDGWTRSFVEQHDCGWYVPPEDDAKLAQCINTIIDAPEQVNYAGQKGYHVARAQFDRVQMIGPLEHILVDSVQPVSEKQLIVATR